MVPGLLFRGAVVAVKMFEALRLDKADDKVINELRMEAQMMERLSNHPNIVKFVGAITQGTSPIYSTVVIKFSILTIILPLDSRWRRSKLCTCD